MSFDAVFSRAGYAMSALALCSLMGGQAAAFAAPVSSQDLLASEKSETVYIYTTPDGTVKETKVKDVLKNDSEAQRIIDATSLSDIEADDADQTFSKDGENIIWLAGGDDVIYTGKPSSDAPITMKVSYKLDGAAIEAKALPGKTGHVEIRYDYLNNAPTYATVRGVSESMYMPFTAITTLLFDSSAFKNVSVENGKLVEDEGRTVAIGYALPGLAQSLSLDGDDADIPDYFAIEADVENFELGSALTMVSAGLLEDLDTSKFDTAGLDGSSSALSEATAQLIEGSKSLTSGLDSLSDGTDALAAGAISLEAGMKGAADALPQLAEAIESLADGSDDLAAGTKGVATALGQLASSMPDMQSASAQVAEGLSTVEANNASALEALSAAAQDPSLSPAIKATLLEAQASLAGNEAILNTYGLLDAASQVSLGIAQATAALGDETDPETIAGAAEAVSKGSSALHSGLSKLNDKSDRLISGINDLVAGTSEMAYGASQLAEGAHAAAEGSGKLTEGLEAYNEEGISQIIEVIDNKIVGLVERMDALSAAAASYDNFSGKAEGTSSSVSFVIETDPIE